MESFPHLLIGKRATLTLPTVNEIRQPQKKSCFNDFNHQREVSAWNKGYKSSAITRR
jgi:hypothetical protein